MRTITIIALALVAMTMTAAQLEVDAAQAVATRFMKSKSSGSLRSRLVTWQPVLTKPSAIQPAAADYYIFNTIDGSNFVIVAGDDRAREVLAYGEGSFDPEQMPDNVKWMLDHYAEQMEYLHAHPDAKPHHSPTSDESVPQLLSTTWGQGAPYRNLCPVVDGNTCVTGCVATAMAQVMNYWKFPDILPALQSYITSTLGLVVPELQATSIEWELMQDSYREGTYTEEQGNAVATLMRYCGQASKMDYNKGDSGAWPWDQLDALKKFGYNQAATFLERDNYSDEAWHRMILEDLNQRCPIIYNGRNNTTSHNFVIDGYDGSRYHINWGWNGAFDGYFELDAMNAGGFKPTSAQQMLHGIRPDESSQSAYELDFIKDGFAFSRLGEDAVTITRNPLMTYSGNLAIPDSIHYNGKSYTVTAIAKSTFSRCNKLTSVEIPGTVTSIGESAFYSSGIQQITIPNSVTDIGSNAFSSCTKLSHIDLSTVLTAVNDHLFADCTALKSIHLPGSVSSIGNSAFKGCDNLADIVLPDALSTIEDYSFYGTAIGGITFPGSLVSIGESAFENCTKLTDVVVTDGARTIGRNSFKGCTSLSQIKLSNTLTEIGNNAFSGTSIIAIDFPASLYSISDSVCVNCKHLETVSFSEGVRSIGNSSFSGCSRLTAVAFASTVNSIGSNSFSGCGFQQVFLPQSVSEIGADAFMGCTSLTEAILEDGFRSISEGLFNGCTKLGSVHLPNTIISIGKRALQGSKALKRIHIPATVRTVGEDAFFLCDSLSTVDIDDMGAWCQIDFTNAYSNPVMTAHHLLLNGTEVNDLVLSDVTASVGNFGLCGMSFDHLTINARGFKSFGASAFYKSSIDSLDIIDTESWFMIDFNGGDANPVDYAKSVLFDGESINLDFVIPDSLTRIGNRAFYKCRWLRSLTIPSSVVEIGEDAFAQCTGLQALYLSDLEAWCRIKFNNADSNPMRYAWYVYLDSLEISRKEFTLPTEITSVCDYAFTGLQITGLHLHNELTSIGDYAFAHNDRLTQVSVPESVSSIGAGAFSTCYNLSSITLEEGLTRIGDEAFCAAKISTLSIPATVDSIGNETFKYCSYLTEITIPDAVTRIGQGLFSNCNRLATAHIGKGVKRIPDNTFRSCSSLSSVEMPNNITAIGNYAFYSTSSLAEFQMPDSVISIGKNAFNSSGIHQIDLTKSVTGIGNSAFADCHSLTEVVIGDQVSELNTLAFSGCTGLKTAVIGDGIQDIEPMAFSGCRNLTTITIGKNVTGIGFGAFLNNTNITSIICKATVPPVIEYQTYYPECFSNVNFTKATLYVPMASVNAYKESVSWKDFKHIEGCCMNSVTGDMNCDNELSIADINALIDAIFMGDSYKLYDLNGDGETNIADINSLILLIIRP